MAAAALRFLGQYAACGEGQHTHATSAIGALLDIAASHLRLPLMVAKLTSCLGTLALGGRNERRVKVKKREHPAFSWVLDQFGQPLACSLRLLSATRQTK